MNAPNHYRLYGHLLMPMSLGLIAIIFLGCARETSATYAKDDQAALEYWMLAQDFLRSLETIRLPSDYVRAPSIGIPSSPSRPAKTMREILHSCCQVLQTKKEQLASIRQSNEDRIRSSNPDLVHAVVVGVEAAKKRQAAKKLIPQDDWNLFMAALPDG